MYRDNTVEYSKILYSKLNYADGHLYNEVDVADFKNENRISVNPRY